MRTLPDRLLAEGSVYELLRRDARIEFDPFIAHAGLIYDAPSRAILADVHRAYVEAAERHSLPILIQTDTWRASAERIELSRFRGMAVNRDNVEFLREMAGPDVYVGAITGPRGDAYRPAEALSADEALRYHAPQIEDLGECELDLITAATLPSLAEAKGIALLLSQTRVPWMLSFVIRAGGTLLDGTPLGDAIRSIDDVTGGSALGFAVNCAHASVVTPLPRLIAFQGNTSRLSPEELDGIATVDAESPDAFAAAVARLPLRILGGCCGSGPAHIEALAARLQPGAPQLP